MLTMQQVDIIIALLCPENLLTKARFPHERLFFTAKSKLVTKMF